MKKIDFQLRSSQIYIDSLPFSEKDIIKLHRTFLTPGFHTIKTYDQKSGLVLIKTLLKSLNYYHEIAYLSMANHHLPKKILNVCKKIERLDTESLRAFVLQNLFCDFLWIEKTQELKRQKYFSDFFKCLKEFNFVNTAPIITVEYTKTGL